MHASAWANTQYWNLKKKFLFNKVVSKKSRCAARFTLLYEHPAEGDCGAARGDLIDTSSVIERRRHMEPRLACLTGFHTWIQVQQAWWNAWFSANFTPQACKHQQFHTHEQPHGEASKQNFTVTFARASFTWSQQVLPSFFCYLLLQLVTLAHF